MPEPSFHVGDIGAVIEYTVTENGAALDISGATTKQLKLLGPGGTVKTRTAAFGTDGTDGVLTYATIAGDLDVKGKWYVQPYLVLPSWTGHGAVAEFIVGPVLA